MQRDTLPAHAKYSPSASSRLLACPLSISLSEQAPPQPESPYAAEGTVAHAHCEEALLHYGAGIPAIEDREMRGAVQDYYDYINPLLDICEAYGIEEKAVANDEWFGTVDCYVRYDGTLEIIDFKYGAGVVVSPDNNKQLMTYAGLILGDPEHDVVAADVDRIMLTIIQPRGAGDAIQSWECAIEDIEKHMDAMMLAMEKAEKPNPEGSMGEHCRWCNAKLICPVIKAAETGVRDWDSRDLSADDLGPLLADAQVIEAKIKELFSYAHAKLEGGMHIPGWKLVPKRATKKWINTDRLNSWAKRTGNLSVLYEKKLITPAQAIKLLGADSMNQFIESSSSGTNLKPTSDPADEVMSLGSALEAIGSLR